ncbi:MAG: DUF87 domain-containing protein [Desulfobacteraceae bacterium]|nr:DUF87 domain-containing protein [Desulfobacteraceae bacterium]
MKVEPWVRVAIMVIATLVILGIAQVFTGSPLPKEPREAIIFQNALLLIVLGSAILEHHFTKPADSVINSLMGLITLSSVYRAAPTIPWSLAAGYCGVVFVMSSACVAASSTQPLTGWRTWIGKHTYRPSIVFGRSRVLFSIVFLSGLWFFYSAQEPVTVALILFWGLFLSLWPLHIPELITSWFQKEVPISMSRGEIVRIDNPNISRVVLDGEAKWTNSGPKICILPDGQAHWMRPIYSQFQEGKLLGTGLITALKMAGISGKKNSVFDPPKDIECPSEASLNQALGGGINAIFVGFVVERSTIPAIRFETVDSDSCYDGMLVWVSIKGKKVYYQITSGETSEESFAGDKHGYQVAVAVQLGTLEEGEGFKKYDWLPSMNTPVFAASPDHPLDINAIREGEFCLGNIPMSEIKVGGDFYAGYNYHTAILGVTGSGKTELAFDLIRHSVCKGLKVVCIDLTAQYEGKLNDLNPVDLSVSQENAEKLSEKLFEVETGKYGAGDEKKALAEFSETLRDDVAQAIEQFLTDNEGSGLGIIRLEEISNTKATLWITELFMTCLLKYARENPENCPKSLMVVEEAHTVMPEPSAMGLGDFDSRGLVGKIAQIALQGRKYGVGLLVVAQRTATVSKTILTQCNSIISFTCYDDTSLGFLKNIYGPEHVAIIPNLPMRQAVAFGPWIRTKRPIVFEVPYDPGKDTNV